MSFLRQHHDTNSHTHPARTHASDEAAAVLARFDADRSSAVLVRVPVTVSGALAESSFPEKPLIEIVDY